MGYSTSAAVRLGVIVPASVFRDLCLDQYKKNGYDEDDEEKEESSRFRAQCAVDCIEEFCKDCGWDQLTVIDMTDWSAKRGKNGDDEECDVWERQFAILTKQSLLATEFWGHSACCETSATVPLSQFALSAQQRVQIDALLQNVKLDPTQFPIQVVLCHNGG